MTGGEEVFSFDLDVGPTRQEWCERCQTSSLVVCDVTHLSDEGVSVLATERRCWRCDA